MDLLSQFIEITSLLSSKHDILQPLDVMNQSCIAFQMGIRGDPLLWLEPLVTAAL